MSTITAVPIGENINPLARISSETSGFGIKAKMVLMHVAAVRTIAAIVTFHPFENRMLVASSGFKTLILAR